MSFLERTSGMTMAVLELVRIGLALYGLFLLMVHGSRAYEAYRSQSWPSTLGEITRSAVDATGSLDGSRTYRSSIVYAYSVEPTENDAEPLISSRIAMTPLPRSTSRSIAQANLEPYPKGSPVTVYYSPSRPERSLLHITFSMADLLRPLAGAFCLLAAFSLRRVGTR